MNACKKYFVLIIIFLMVGKSLCFKKFGNKNGDKKNIREQLDELQVEIVKMSLQFSNLLKNTTGKGLDVCY